MKSIGDEHELQEVVDDDFDFSDFQEGDEGDEADAEPEEVPVPQNRIRGLLPPLEKIVVDVGPKQLNGRRQISLIWPDGRRFENKTIVSKGAPYFLEKLQFEAEEFFGLPANSIPGVQGEILEAAAIADKQGAEARRKPKGPRFIFKSAFDLDAMQIDTEAIVSNVVYADNPLVVGADPKQLKTLLICGELAVSVAAGCPFLNDERFAVPKARPVAVFSAETGLAALRDAMRKIAVAKGTTLAALGDKLLVTGEVPNLASDEDMQGIEALIKDRKMQGGLLVIDPAYMALAESNASVLNSVAPLLHRLAALCHKLHVTPAVVHHTKRCRNPYRVPGLTDLTGAGYAEFARSWLFIGRRQLYQYDGIHRLTIVSGGSAGHSGRWGVVVNERKIDPPSEPQAAPPVPRWEVKVQGLGKAAAKGRQRDRLKADAKAIVRFLGSVPGGVETLKAVREATYLRPAAADVAIKALLKSGRIVESAIKKSNRNKPYPAYKLGDIKIPRK